MKNTILIIWVAASVLAVGLYVHQVQKTSELSAELAGLRLKAADADSRESEEKHESESVQKKLREARADADAKTSEAARLEEALTNQAAVSTQALASTADSAATTNKSNPLADMFKKPEMRDFIKAQQKTVFGTMMEKNYGTFMTGLNMTPEQSSAFKDLVLKKFMVDADMGMNLMGGDVTADKRTELVDQAKKDKEGIDQQIKAFLGDDLYPQFQTYEKSMPERMVLSGFKDQMVTGGSPLSADQESQLVSAMQQERQGFKFTTDLSDQSKFTGDPAAFFTEDRMNQFFQEQSKLQEQYVSRANSILSADQLTSFQKFLNTQADMQKAGMQMAVKMFGQKN
jgi:hypothetical protein